MKNFQFQSVSTKQKQKTKQKKGRRFKDGNIPVGIYSKSAPEQWV